MEIVPFDPTRASQIVKQQAELGKFATKSWSYFFQTGAERLIEIYSSPEFDPSTRLYAIEEELVGFITSKVLDKRGEDELYLGDKAERTANLMVPISHPYSKGVDRALLEAALDVLRSKGVKKIVCNVGFDWGKLELIESFGFVKYSDLLMEAKCSVTEFPSYQRNCVDLEEKHMQEAAELLSKHLGYSVETALSVLSSPPESYTIRGSFCFVDDDVKGFVRVAEVGGVWQMGPIYTDDLLVATSLLGRVRQLMEEREVESIRVLCGKQGRHLLKLLPFDFESVIGSYQLDF